MALEALWGIDDPKERRRLALRASLRGRTLHRLFIHVVILLGAGLAFGGLVAVIETTANIRMNSIDGWLTGALFGGLSVYIANRHRRRELPHVLHADGRCTRCGYRVADTGVNACPECGKAVIDDLEQE